jgi:hypothetical protein
MIPASARPQTYALDRAVTGIDNSVTSNGNNIAVSHDRRSFSKYLDGLEKARKKVI